MHRSILIVTITCCFALVACLDTEPFVEDETIGAVEEALTCLPLEYCPDPTTIASFCEAEGREVTPEPCGCLTCTKLEGEPCGGLWDLQGICNSELVCQPTPDGQSGVCVAE